MLSALIHRYGMIEKANGRCRQTAQLLLLFKAATSSTAYIQLFGWKYPVKKALSRIEVAKKQANDVADWYRGLP